MLRNSERGGLAARACAVGLAAILGGCSVTEIIQDWTLAPRSDLSQPDYRRIVTDAIDKILPGRVATDELEISDTRLVDSLKGPAWLTCLKIDPRGHPRHLAIFIQDNKIAEWRSGLVIDQCHKASYTPLVVPASAKKPAT
jgi:hypothetical protein